MTPVTPTVDHTDAVRESRDLIAALWAMIVEDLTDNQRMRWLEKWDILRELEEQKGAARR